MYCSINKNCICNNFTFLSVLFIIDGAAKSKIAWQKQLGTVNHPKMPQYFTQVRFGETFLFDDRRFMSRYTGQIKGNEPLTSNNLWIELHPGSFMWPKVLSPILPIRVYDGDIIHNPVTNSYYVYKNREDGQSRLITQTSAGMLDELDYKQEWMTLLRPLIGDQRFGDIILPGTHDSASWGITENSYLVGRDIFTQFIYDTTPATEANWSLTQPTSLLPHLNAGYRNLDLRVADMIEQNDTFRWWHNMAADPIFDGLAEVREFALQHPEEVLFLYFQHFVSPGNAISSTLPITVPRKQELAEIILDYLGDLMVPKANLSDNPTINEILASGGNIIAQMADDYIRTNYEGFWPVVVVSDWIGMSNPEDLFLDRSSKLERFLREHPNEITDISGCNTPSTKNRVASIILAYRHNENLTELAENLLEIINEMLPLNLTELPEPEQMSFEGLYFDLLTMAKNGTNTLGMYARPAENYTNGASVHYRGVNEMLPYWIARSQRYKMNIIYVDDFPTSTFVETAIQANLGQIPRQVTIAFQGNPKDGYLEWRGFETFGGKDGLACNATSARYFVTSEEFTINAIEEWTQIPVRTVVDISEGQYPPDAIVNLQVSTNTVDWYDIFQGHIQTMIDQTFDVYLRSTDLGDDHGFAYVSLEYNAFADSCDTIPVENFFNITQW